VVSYVIVGSLGGNNILVFSMPRTAFCAFSETDLWDFDCGDQNGCLGEGIMGAGGFA
jgi:hypothetical protein